MKKTKQKINENKQTNNKQTPTKHRLDLKKKNIKTKTKQTEFLKEDKKKITDVGRDEEVRLNTYT